MIFSTIFMIIQKNLYNFFKRETVFSIALILAVISCFFAKPSMDYINWDTIILLLAIMFVVEILRNLAVFEKLVRRLLVKVSDTRQLVLFLVFTCFFTSIFITNDVSLIIFVPFSILALKKVKKSDLAVITVSLQTIASNIGCMVLPIGAPHNIVMYTISHIPFESFFLLLLPYIVVSAVFLMAVSLLIPKENIILSKMEKIDINRSDFFKKVFLGIDYYLLLTFIALFILIGNLESISVFRAFFKQCIVGNEVLWGVISSQIISNVPSAMLLSAFTTNYSSIIIGINIGGLGTLIASMANLISYKIIVRSHPEFKIRYLMVFTVLNVVLLVILFSVYLAIPH